MPRPTGAARGSNEYIRGSREFDTGGTPGEEIDMKIIHVLASRIYTGAEKVVCQIIRSFQNDPGVEMVYCSPDSDNVRQMLALQGVPFAPMTALTPGELKRVIREQKPDLIHAHDMRASFVSALCAGGIPILSHIHNNAYDARGLSAKSIAYILAGIRAKHIFWVSASSFSGYFFHNLFAKKSSILYNIIDARQIYGLLAADENSYRYDLVFVGRLTYQKDPQRLMRLCARLRERKPDLRAAVVGAGELEGETKALAQDLGLASAVEFLGFQKNPIKIVHDSAALILTSRWEGTPMCALEAMAVGTPVVSTPSDGMADLIESGVSGYLGETDEELAEGVMNILDSPDHRRQLGEQAKRRFAQINDEEKYKRVLAESYRKWGSGA